jgi:hypothetical protein
MSFLWNAVRKQRRVVKSGTCEISRSQRYKGKVYRNHATRLCAYEERKKAMT